MTLKRSTSTMQVSRKVYKYVEKLYKIVENKKL